jgi:protein-L-isoaspartate(D-aspartate) O-methyltransferase
MTLSRDDEARKLRQALVAALKERGELADPRLEEAFLHVPRHNFLPDMPLDMAYADEAVPVKHDPDGNVISSASQPTMMALMLRQLRLEPGHNVLEIGAGTGYNAAIMQYLVGRDGHVTTLELDKDLVRQVETNLQRISAGNIRVVHADGAGGYAPRAAYDRVISTAGVWDIPRAWFEQLKPRGIVVAPVWVDAMQLSAAFTEQDDGTYYSGRNLPCGFILMRGTAAGPGLSLQVGHSALLLTSNEVQTLDGAALHILLSESSETDRLSLRLDAGDYYNGFLPFLVLNRPADYVFAVFNVAANQQAYGLSGTGFALVGAGSACFASYGAYGEVSVFGSPDSFMVMQSVLNAWDAAGRPGAKALRLRLIPRAMDRPQISSGQIFEREYHYLHVWQA